MFSQKYQPLEQTSSNTSKEELPEYDVGPQWAKQQSSLKQAWKITYTLCILLVITIGSNVMLFLKLHETKGHADAQSFVGLERNIPMQIPHDDRTIDDPMWDAPEYDWYAGWVALDDDFVKAKGVPTSMRWPWDSSKSIYVFHSFHSLHCVFVLRESIMQYRDNEHQTWPFGHVTHCLHVLREDATCNADDTPRYTGHLHAQENHTMLFSGVGQTRMCRDWSQLRQFAVEHSACYRRPSDHYLPLLDRYKDCPDGSKPWEQMAG